MFDACCNTSVAKVMVSCTLIIASKRCSSPSGARFGAGTGGEAVDDDDNVVLGRRHCVGGAVVQWCCCSRCLASLIHCAAEHKDCTS